MLVSSRDDAARALDVLHEPDIHDKPVVRIGGLDGLRAVAVIAVVAYHLWPDHLQAGFLGVDLFMVLSGFLITGLLIDERARAGAVRLGAFWVRRFRRLVPALLALLVAVAVWVNISGAAELKRTVRGQGIASLFYVGNWKLVAEGTSYASLSNAPSPLLHLWSLAIEEQFYLVWPLVVVGVLLLARGRRAALMVVAAAGAVASAAWMAASYRPHVDPLRLYYGTDTRAQAFLIGAVAVIAARRYTGERAQRIVRTASIPAFVVVVAAFALLHQPDILYRGGFAAFAIAAAIVVVAVTNRGPVTSTLDRGPLRLVGRVSYGIYLWHWPIIVLVTARTAHVNGVALLALRLGLIAAATAASWLLIERPYQRAPRLPALPLAPAGIAVAALALLMLPTTQTVAYASYDVNHVPAPEVSAVPTKLRAATTSTSTSTLVPNTSAPTTSATTASAPLPLPSTASSAPEVVTTEPAPPPFVPHTVLVLGDSGTYDMSPAFVAGFANAGIRLVSTAYPGEGLTRPDGVLDTWTNAIRDYKPDYFIVGLGTWDNEFIADNGADAYRAKVDSVLQMLTAQSPHVLWMSVLPSDSSLPDDRPRPDIQEQIYEGLPAKYPGVVDFLDLKPALSAADGTTPREIDGHLLRKPDGWHLCPDGAAAITHLVLTHLGLDSNGWDQGDWRTDKRYNDPPGGCTTG